MKILRRETVWIHTHFVTDCLYLPDHLAREIQREMAQVLDQERIVFGIHFDARAQDEGLRIVLECIPLADPMARIEAALAAIIKDMPARPRRTRVAIEPPPARSIGLERS